MVQGSSGQVSESSDGHSRKEAQCGMGTLRFFFFFWIPSVILKSNLEVRKHVTVPSEDDHDRLGKRNSLDCGTKDLAPDQTRQLTSRRYL